MTNPHAGIVSFLTSKMQAWPPDRYVAEYIQYLLCRGVPGSKGSSDRSDKLTSYFQKIGAPSFFQDLYGSEINIALFGTLPWALTQRWASEINIAYLIGHWTASCTSRHYFGSDKIDVLLDNILETASAIDLLLPRCNDEQKEGLVILWISQLLTHCDFKILWDNSNFAPTTIERSAHLWILTGRLLGSVPQVHHKTVIRWSGKVQPFFQTLDYGQQKSIFIAFMKANDNTDVKLRWLNDVSDASMWLDKDLEPDILALLGTLKPLDRIYYIPWSFYMKVDTAKLNVYKEVFFHYCQELSLPFSLLTVEQFTSPYHLQELLREYTACPTETLSLDGILDT